MRRNEEVNEAYFYSLCCRSEVKKRKCLRCGKLFKTGIGKRACAECEKRNSTMGKLAVYVEGVSKEKKR